MDSSYALQKKLVTLEENLELLQEENDHLKTSFQHLKSQRTEQSKPGPPGPPGIAGPPGPISSIDIDFRDLTRGPDLYSDLNSRKIWAQVKIQAAMTQEN